MTLLSALAAVANEIGATAPTAIINSSDQTAKRLYGAIQTACAELIRRHDWTVLHREETITTADGTASYALPSAGDFLRAISDTMWDATNYWKMRGSLSPSQWQFVKRSQIANTSTRRRFRLKWDTVTKTRRIYIDPTPSSVDTLVYEYVSTHFIQATGGGATKAAFTVDTDVLLLDEELVKREVKWRYLASRGLPYAEEKQESERAIIRAIGDDAPAETVVMGGPAAVFAVNLPDGNFTL